jgi:hypothetical protein
MLISGVLIVLFHDNACPHTTDHPPYSPHLAPGDYHLFTYWKNWLWSQRFNNNEELMEGVNTSLSSQAADFLDICIQELISQYKCLNSGGDYVEKQPKYERIFCI